MFSNTVPIAGTAVLDAVAHFVPRLADLIERFRLSFLALVWKRKEKNIYVTKVQMCLFSGWETSALARFTKIKKKKKNLGL